MYIQLIPVVLLLAINIAIPMIWGWYLLLKNRASTIEKWIWSIIILFTSYIGVLGYYIYISKRNK